jgi:predicted bacteriocin transport accessory protein
MKNNDNGTGLKKIKDLLYVIIGLLVVSLIIGVINTSNIVALSKDDTKTTDTEEETNSDYDVSKFTEVDFAGLKSAIAQDGYVVVYMGVSSCPNCVNFIPVLKQAQIDYNYTTYYVDMDKITQEEVTYIYSLDDYFDEEFGYTPLIAVFKDGKFVKGRTGYTEYASYASFLEASGLKK